MTVDFGYAKCPTTRVAFHAWSGAYSERTIRTRFEQLHRAVVRAGGRPGRWIFREPGERRWEVEVEVTGKVTPAKGLRIKTVRPCTVARVAFDPDSVSPRVVYHGLSDWLRWQRRQKEIRAVGDYREVYRGNPWTDAKAWANTEIQVVVRR